MTAKIRIEWLRLQGDADSGDANAPLTEYGVQEIIVTGSSPQSSAAAPYFGLVDGVERLEGVARVKVIYGAVIVAAGASPVPTETNGYRIQEPEFEDIPVQTGQFVAAIEAADPITTSTFVTDADADASLTAQLLDDNAMVTSLAGAKTDLDSLVTGDSQAHTDAGTAHADSGTLHTDLTSANTLATGEKADLDTMVSAQGAAETQAHTDAGTAHADAGVIEGDINTAASQAHGDEGQLHTDEGVVESDITSAGSTAHTDAGVIAGDINTAASQAHGDEGQLHTDEGVVESDITSAGSTAHTDAGVIAGDINTAASQAHGDEGQLHTDEGVVEADINAAGTQAHTDAGTAHADEGVVEGDITAAGTAAHTDAGTAHTDAGTAHTDAGVIETDITAAGTQAHTDATAANASLAAIAAKGQAAKAASISVTPASDPDTRVAAANITAADVLTIVTVGQSGVSLVSGAPSVNSSQVWALNGHSSAALTFTGPFVASVNIEVSADGGLTYAPASGKIRGTPVTASTVTAPGLFQVDVTGITHIRSRCTAFTSGTVAVAATASASPGLTQIINPIRLVDSSGNNATVKPATTQASTADTALVVAPIAGSTGRDYSADAPAIPNVGANFGGSGPFASYVRVGVVAANPSRANIDVENATGAQIVLVRDDGTAATAAAPVNASAFPLAGGALAGAQGGSWASTTFKGRIQVYAPAALSGNQFVAMMED